MRRLALISGAVCCVPVLAVAAWGCGEGPGAGATSRTFDRSDLPFVFDYPANLDADDKRPRRDPYDPDYLAPSRLEPPGGAGGLILIARDDDQELSIEELRDRDARARLERMSQDEQAEPPRREAFRVERHSGIEMAAEDTGYLEGDWTLQPTNGRRYRFALAGATWRIDCGGLGRRRRLIREACDRIVGSIRPRAR